MQHFHNNTRARLSIVALLILAVAGCATGLRDSDMSKACRYGGTLDRFTGKYFDSASADRPSARPIVKVIEFSEEGELVDRCEYTEVLTEIIAAPKKDGKRIESANVREANPAKMIVIYVHGWKHGAATDDDDLQQFSSMIRELGDHEDRAGKHRQVIGIYAAWPGSTTTLPLLEHLTFWSRKRAADRVSQAAYLSKLIGAIDSILCRRNNPDDHFVVIGHSFGARILFTATSQVLLQNLQVAYPDSQRKETYKLVHGPVDLTILLNPAFEAARYTAFDSSRREFEQFNPRQQPVVLSISTDNDMATKLAFPLGQVLDFEWRDRQMATLGNYAPYTTHDLIVAPGHDPRNAPIAWYDGYCSDGICLRSREHSPQPGNPFIVAATTKEIVNDHGGIWDASFRGWMLGFIRTAESRRTTASAARCVAR